MIPFYLRLVLSLAILAAPLGAQRVELRIAGKPAPDTVSIFAYDTLYNLEAVALDTRGRKAPSAKPTLALHMWSVAKLVQSSRAKGHVVGLSRGVAFAIGTWARSDGLVVMDTLWIGVPRPRAMSLAVCSSFEAVETDAGMLRQCITGFRLVTGASTCAYVVAKDRRGAYITGIDPQLRSSDPHVAVLSSSAACPDTTVDPAKLLYPLPLR
jgi:hypothetical protein